MRPIHLIAAAGVFAMMTAAPAAAPLRADLDAVTTTNVIQVHNTCHQGFRTHGGAYPSHNHHPATCAPQYAGGPGGGGDCHANWQTHFVHGYGHITHRHVGNNCAVDIAGGGYGAPGPSLGIGGCFGGICFYGR
jgi:hypothetical protein